MEDSFFSVLIMLGGILFWVDLFWKAQVKLGNWLKHKHPNWKVLRFFWWSMCDVEGFCEYEIYDTFLRPQHEEAQKEIKENGISKNKIKGRK